MSSTQTQPLADAEASPVGEDEFVPSTALEPTPDTPEDEEDEDLSLETINIEWTDEA